MRMMPKLPAEGYCRKVACKVHNKVNMACKLDNKVNIKKQQSNNLQQKIKTK